MAVSSRPPANGFVAAVRKVYNPMGFSKGYNFILAFILAGGMIGFTLARAMYFNYNGVFCAPGPGGSNHAAPGECWEYSTKDFYKIGIQLHLYTILPAGFLAAFQFIPVIRYKVLLLHRINGYLAILLATIGTAGALMIARISFGGGMEIQVFVGFLSIIFVASLGLAVYNIKMLQIEQHRAWMLRAWIYAGSIITSRLFMIIAALLISSPTLGPYYKSMSCEKLNSFYTDQTEFLDAYPVCTDSSAWASVEASMNLKGENAGAALYLNFGMGLWLALALHAMGVEIYLHLTPAESERLRNISYQRQMEAGHKSAGRSGLTADRLGDSAMWEPTVSMPHKGSESAGSGQQ